VKVCNLPQNEPNYSCENSKREKTKVRVINTFGFSTLTLELLQVLSFSVVKTFPTSQVKKNRKPLVNNAICFYLFYSLFIFLCSSQEVENIQKPSSGMSHLNFSNSVFSVFFISTHVVALVLIKDLVQLLVYL
jgi:hypothetical protein